MKKSSWLERIRKAIMRTPRGMMACRVLFIFYITLKYALTNNASMGFSIGIPAKRLTFYLQPQKVSKKGRSPNYVLHPII
jgi:hypothetical protein